MPSQTVAVTHVPCRVNLRQAPIREQRMFEPGQNKSVPLSQTRAEKIGALAGNRSAGASPRTDLKE